VLGQVCLKPDGGKGLLAPNPNYLPGNHVHKYSGCAVEEKHGENDQRVGKLVSPRGRKASYRDGRSRIRKVAPITKEGLGKKTEKKCPRNDHDAGRDRE